MDRWGMMGFMLWAHCDISGDDRKVADSPGATGRPVQELQPDGHELQCCHYRLWEGRGVAAGSDPAVLHA